MVRRGGFGGASVAADAPAAASVSLSLARSRSFPRSGLSTRARRQSSPLPTKRHAPAVVVVFVELDVHPSFCRFQKKERSIPSLTRPRAVLASRALEREVDVCLCVCVCE